MTEPPGFFGKIPSRGDFLSRRIPHGVAPAWEAWLQELTVGARSRQVPGFADAWLTAPLWHFLLGSDLAPPCGAAGVLIASTDRVGRLFPFTILGLADPGSGYDQQGWWQAAESLILSALEEDYEPTTLDSALIRLGSPPQMAGVEGRTGVWPVALDGEWPAAGDPLADDASQRPGPGQSVWWCRGSDLVAPVRLRCHGLPSPRISAAMILGGNELGSG